MIGRVSDQRWEGGTHFRLHDGCSLRISIGALRVDFAPTQEWTGSMRDALRLILDPAYRDCWKGDDLFAVKTLVAGGALEDGTIT